MVDKAQLTEQALNTCLCMKSVCSMHIQRSSFFPLKPLMDGLIGLYARVGFFILKASMLGKKNRGHFPAPPAPPPPSVVINFPIRIREFFLKNLKCQFFCTVTFYSKVGMHRSVFQLHHSHFPYKFGNSFFQNISRTARSAKYLVFYQKLVSSREF